MSRMLLIPMFALTITGIMHIPGTASRPAPVSPGTDAALRTSSVGGGVRKPWTSPYAIARVDGNQSADSVQNSSRLRV
jgi:hypothetical protein